MTNRPAPSVASENIAHDVRQHLEGILPRLTERDDVVGVTLNGGVARGHADELSEVDLTVYLTKGAKREWRRGRGPVATGITTIDGQLYDVKSTSLTGERERDWSAVERWDASYADILYDPQGEVGDLIDEKLTWPSVEDGSGPLFECWWGFELACNCWILRGDPHQAHFVLNDAVTALCKALFVANEEHVPHRKWLVHLSRSLEWTPVDWTERLGSALETTELTIDDVHRRQAGIESLWIELDEYVRKNHYPDLPVSVMQMGFFVPLRTLVEDAPIAVDNWEASFGLELLGMEPFHTIAVVDRDEVVLDVERLLEIGPDDMYQWHYELLDAVRSESEWND